MNLCRAQSNSSKAPAEKLGRLFQANDGKQELAKVPQLQARKKHPTFPKNKKAKNTLQGFSSLPEELWRLEAHLGLHGKLGDAKKYFWKSRRSEARG